MTADVCRSCGVYARVLSAAGECMTCLVEALERRSGISKRYFLNRGSGTEQEVSEAEFVEAERAAGFHNTLGRRDKPATSGFGNGRVSGRVEYVRRESAPRREPTTPNPSKPETRENE